MEKPKDKLHVTMWNNGSVECIDEVKWVTAYFGGYMMYDDCFYILSKRSFTEDEATQALMGWYKDIEDEFDYDPNWKTIKVGYRVVVKDKKSTYYENLADADIDWDSIEEYERANNLELGSQFVTNDGYLWIYREVK